MFNEDDELIGDKVSSVINANMIPVLCIGETIEELNEGLAKANDSLNAGNPNYRRNNNTQSNQQPLKRTVTGQLQSEYVSGYNKICTYKGISGEFTKTISRAYTCPLYETIEID